MNTFTVKKTRNANQTKFLIRMGQGRDSNTMMIHVINSVFSKKHFKQTGDSEFGSIY